MCHIFLQNMIKLFHCVTKMQGLIWIGFLIFIHMESVFNVAPPSFSKDEISQIALKHYSIKGETSELFSDRDQNFLIRSIEKSYILKVSNPIEEAEVIDLQEKAIEYVLRTEPEIELPNQIGSIVIVKRDGRSYMIRLLRFIEGNFLSDNDLTETGYRKMGIFLGRLTKAMDGFDHPSAHRKFDWDARQTDLMMDKLCYIDSPINQNTIIHFLDEFKTNVKPLTDDLRMSIVHNDGNDHNILVNDKCETIGIIDFGDMVHSYTVMDPSVCLAYIALGKQDPLPDMISMLDGYHSIYKLNDVELRSIVYLMCLRICLTAVMASWRKRLFPDNDYLVISEASAWKFLKDMQHQDLNKWTKELTKNVR